MKNTFIIVLPFIYNIALAQNEEPESYSKIIFTYDQKSNFSVQDGIVYADTLLLKVEFPKMQFKKILNPKDSSTIIGSIELKNFGKDEINKLESQLYHITHKIQGVYNLKTNKTTLFYKRGNEELIKTYKQNFNRNFMAFSYKIIIDYNKKTVNINYPRAQYSKSFQSIIRKINFTDNNKEHGTFSYQTTNGFSNDVLNLNKAYNSKITTDVIFTNNDYGVEKIVSFYDTTTLLSVKYE
ncbi:hypothetical protein [Flavobacterium sp. GSP14]|uniref:hypothetical protein n=1 Tax=Flavobacterium sp. GSP14 TaxID=3401734 RepID=UPI003AAE11D4